jgi:uncharacterized protein (TIGR02452 family)
LIIEMKQHDLMDIPEGVFCSSRKKYGFLFNPFAWRVAFEAASKTRASDQLRALRAEIFQGTVACVQAGRYGLQAAASESEVLIPNTLLEGRTEFFDVPEALPPQSHARVTQFSVIGADCLEVAETLKKSGLNPCVLNLSNRQNPGGGVLHGAGAQEENLFRRSNLFLSLYPFASYAAQYGLAKHEKSYPLDRNTGGIYSGSVTVFRGSEQNGYRLLRHPFQVAFVSVAAMNRPELVAEADEWRVVETLIEPIRRKIRTILRLAGKYQHNALVLSAFGCGAFRNPPRHIAELFREVFAEPEFQNYFELVVFAILEDHNSYKEHNPQGNLLPFSEVFDALATPENSEDTRPLISSHRSW